MPKILTVSVAAYNMDKYLDECLESMAIPEIVDDLEVFVIDDGGTDRSLEIAQSYADKYPGTFIPVHKENGGWGSTVNYSMQHATGKYFKILDGDDWFDKDGFVRLVHMLKTSEADVITSGFYFAMGNARKLEKGYEGVDHKIRKIQEVIHDLPVLKLPELCYRTEILMSSSLKLPEHMFYCDLYYQTIPFVFAQSIQSLGCPVVIYRIGREGQSVSVSSKLKHQDEYVSICKDLIDFMSKLDKTQVENYPYLVKRMATTYRGTFSVLRLNPINKGSLRKIKQLEDYLKKNLKDVYSYTMLHGGKYMWLLRKSNYLSYWISPLLRKKT